MNTSEVAQALHQGDLVVFPTETVYGLGALASDDQAVRKIFAVKGRPAHNPLILHIAELSGLSALVDSIPDNAHQLIEAFWPGPLTICLKKSSQVSDLVTAGLPTVCIRMPHHQLAQKFLKSVGEAVAAPSANLSGKPSTTTFQDAYRQLSTQGVHFLDGGASPLGIESTVVDCSRKEVHLLRPGAISVAEMEAVLKTPILIPDEKGKITSPGQLLEHYAPNGELTVLLGNKSSRTAWFSKLPPSMRNTGYFGLVSDLSDLTDFPHHKILSSSEDDLDQIASHLYSFLNCCDSKGATDIFVELPLLEKHPLFPALFDRLQKASSGNIVELSL